MRHTTWPFTNLLDLNNLEIQIWKMCAGYSSGTTENNITIYWVLVWPRGLSGVLGRTWSKGLSFSPKSQMVLCIHPCTAQRRGAIWKWSGWVSRHLGDHALGNRCHVLCRSKEEVLRPKKALFWGRLYYIFPDWFQNTKIIFYCNFFFGHNLRYKGGHIGYLLPEMASDKK